MKDHPRYYRNDHKFGREKGPQQWHETPGFAVVLAGTLTLAARGYLIHGAVPLFCGSSPEKRTGKTAVINCAVIAAIRHKPTTVTFKDEEEFGKVLVPILMQQDRAVLIDNLTLHAAQR